MKKTKGLTLVELLLTVAVLTIVSAVAVPSFDGVVRRRVRDGEASRLFATIFLARSEAIKRNTTVTLCKSADQATCSGTWGDGWVVFSDRNRNREVDGDDVIVETVSGLSHGYTLKFNAFGSNDYLNFDPTGLTNQNGTFTFCPPDNDVQFAKQVIVSKTGRARTKTTNITCP